MQMFTMMSSTAICLVICLCFLFWLDRRGGLVIALNTRHDVLAGGNQLTCSVEGESVSVPSVPNIKCFNCTCRNGFVKCFLPKCAPSEDCRDHEVLQNDECCPKCKGCMKNGTHYESGSQWRDKHDPCKIFTCVAGVITETSTRCYTPCVNPMPPAPGQCCPICPGTGSYLNPSSGACLLGSSVHKTGSQFNLNDCTQCSCNNSKIYCKKKSCPVLNCSRGEQRALPGQCCPQCRADDNEAVEIKPIVRPHKGEIHGEEELLKPLEKKQQVLKKKSCAYGGKMYRYGDKWNTAACETCTCIQGKINCTTIMCPAVKCPPNSIHKVPEGTCCPVCEGRSNRDRGVCTIIDGSHFRTFDRKVYAFIGSCKYQLASDCDSSTFGMRLRTTVLGNDVQIRRISLKLGATRVDLQQNRNTKVNDEIVDLPYQLENQLRIAGNNEGVTVTSSMGIKVQWNFVGFLEVTLPESYRKRVCGLCGNFNGLPDDDLTTREGILVDEAAIFAQSWATGKEECLDTRKYSIRRGDPRKDKRMCSYIKGSVFENCLKTIFVTSYYETCLRDCSSDNLRCHCKSFANSMDESSFQQFSRSRSDMERRQLPRQEAHEEGSICCTPNVFRQKRAHSGQERLAHKEHVCKLRQGAGAKSSRCWDADDLLSVKKCLFLGERRENASGEESNESGYSYDWFLTESDGDADSEEELAFGRKQFVYVSEETQDCPEYQAQGGGYKDLPDFKQAREDENAMGAKQQCDGEAIMMTIPYPYSDDCQERMIVTCKVQISTGE